MRPSSLLALLLLAAAILVPFFVVRQAARLESEGSVTAFMGLVLAFPLGLLLLALAALVEWLGQPERKAPPRPPTP